MIDKRKVNKYLKKELKNLLKKELKQEIKKNIVITSYSIHYTKLYDFP